MLEFTFDISDALAFNRKLEERALKMALRHGANKAIQRAYSAGAKDLAKRRHGPRARLMDGMRAEKYTAHLFIILLFLLFVDIVLVYTLNFWAFRLFWFVCSTPESHYSTDDNHKVRYDHWQSLSMCLWHNSMHAPAMIAPDPARRDPVQDKSEIGSPAVSAVQIAAPLRVIIGAAIPDNTPAQDVVVQPPCLAAS